MSFWSNPTALSQVQPFPVSHTMPSQLDTLGFPFCTRCEIEEKPTKISLPPGFQISTEDERKVQTENKKQVAQESTLHCSLCSQQI